MCDFQGASCENSACLRSLRSRLRQSLKTIQAQEKRHSLCSALRCSVVLRRLLFFRQTRFRSSAVRPWFELHPFGLRLLPRKEVIQPHLPIRLPCYDFTPVIDLTLGGWLLAVTSPLSGAINSHGVTGGVYKARERIHRGMLIRDY